jgi:hypothetical protein
VGYRVGRKMALAVEVKHTIAANLCRYSEIYNTPLQRHGWAVTNQHQEDRCEAATKDGNGVDISSFSTIHRM